MTTDDDLRADNDRLRERVRELEGRAAGERARCAAIAIQRADHHRDNCSRECRCADGWHIAAAILETPEAICRAALKAVTTDAG